MSVPISFKLRSLAVLLLTLSSALSMAQVAAPAPTAPKSGAGTSAHPYLRAGDKAFRQNDYAAAELDYRRALEAGDASKAAYNLGLSLARQKRFKEARESFEQAAANDDNPQARADALYNAGKAALEEQNPQAAIKSLVEGLKISPQDEPMRQQLAQALRMIKQQQKHEQQEQDQGKQSQESQDKKEQQQEEQNQQQGESQNDEPSGENSKPESEQQQEPQTNEGETAPTGNPEDLSPQEARRLLEIAREQERRTQERIRLGESKSNKPLKDW